MQKILPSIYINDWDLKNLEGRLIGSKKMMDYYAAVFLWKDFLIYYQYYFRSKCKHLILMTLLSLQEELENNFRNEA